VPDIAYLVIREGSKWTDVFRLVPGQAVTIGRAPTNQIVLKDDRCSRNHAELFLSGDQWTVRDLDSRNGTVVGEELLKQDRILIPGDVIRIGRSQLVFVHTLSQAFSESTAIVRRPERESLDDTAFPVMEDESDVLAGYDPTTIMHRRGQTRFLEPGEPSPSGIAKVGEAATSCAGSPSIWPGPPTSPRWPKWPWPDCSTRPTSTPARSSCSPATTTALRWAPTWSWSPRGPVRTGGITGCRTFWPTL